MIPVTIGATGSISKSHRQYLSNILGKHEVKDLQKTVIMCAAHTVSRVLMYSTSAEHSSWAKGEITLHVAQIVNTEQLRDYVP